MFVLAAITAPLSPLFDPDEGYYPATAAETLRSGSFWDLRFNGAPRWDKPILSYALIEAAQGAFGESVAASRLPSAIEGAMLVALVGLLVVRMASPRAGILSATVVATTLGISMFSRVSHPELALATSVTATELLFCAWLLDSTGSSWRWAAAAGASVGCGLLDKGPVAAVLPILAGLAAWPFVKMSRPRWSVIADMVVAFTAAAVVALPWYGAMTARHGRAFLIEAVWRQNISRYTGAMHIHGVSSAALGLSALIALFPWTGFLPQAIARVFRTADDSRKALRVTMAASAITALAFFAVSSSKLPSYALVAVPPLAVLIGLWFDEELDELRSPLSTLAQSTVVLALCAMALLLAPFLVGRFVTTRQLLGAIRPDSSDVGTLVAPITVPLGLVFAAALVAMLLLKPLRRRVIVMAVVGTCVPLMALVYAQPILRNMYPWEQLGERVEAGRGRVWLVGRRAPSLTFYARQPVFTVDSEAALEPLVEHEAEGWVALSRQEWSVFARTAAAKHAQATVVAASGRMLLVRFQRSTPLSSRLLIGGRKLRALDDEDVERSFARHQP